MDSKKANTVTCRFIQSLLWLSTSSQINQRLPCEHIALGCGDPQRRTGAAARHGRLTPRQDSTVERRFVDDQMRGRYHICPRLEPEPVRSVQRVTAVRSARKERCVQKSSEMVDCLRVRGAPLETILSRGGVLARNGASRKKGRPERGQGRSPEENDPVRAERTCRRHHKDVLRISGAQKAAAHSRLDVTHPWRG